MINDLTLVTVNYNTYHTERMLETLMYAIDEYVPAVIIDGVNNQQLKELKNFFNVININDFKNNIDNNIYTLNNYGAIINYILENNISTKYVMLVDCNIIFKHDIKLLLGMRTDYDCIAEIGKDSCPPERILPYCVIFDVEKLKNEKINFFDPSRFRFLTDTLFKNNIYINGKNEITETTYLYDLGASFYDDIRFKWSINDIKLDEYMKIYNVNNDMNLMSLLYGSDDMTYNKFIEQNRELLEIK